VVHLKGFSPESQKGVQRDYILNHYKVVVFEQHNKRCGTTIKRFTWKVLGKLASPNEIDLWFVMIQKGSFYFGGGE
jgi:hypothetical protein